MEDDDSDTFEVKLTNLICANADYFSIEDPSTTLLENVRKSVASLTDQIESETVEFKTSQTPYICTNYLYWRREALNTLEESMGNFLNYQKQQAMKEFVLVADAEMFESFKRSVRKAYQRYAIAERLRYRLFAVEDYERSKGENDMGMLGVLFEEN